MNTQGLHAWGDEKHEFISLTDLQWTMLVDATRALIASAESTSARQALTGIGKTLGCIDVNLVEQMGDDQVDDDLDGVESFANPLDDSPTVGDEDGESGGDDDDDDEQ